MAELDTNVSIDPTANTETNATITTPNTEPPLNENAEIKRLQAELAKAINKNDALSKENAEQRKQIRARQSAEEIAAEEKRIADEAMQTELNTLRKRFAVAETSKKIMSFVGDEAVSTNVAEYLYGAEDVDAALAAIQKAWTAKEKALRLEYGKIPAPGVGGSDGPTLTKEQLDKMDYLQRVEFANKHPDEYAKLMGRT